MLAGMPMVAWERDDEGRGHSVARWEPVENGWLFHGAEVLIIGEEMMFCTFQVRVDATWQTVAAHVVALSESGERTLTLTVDELRRWTVDGQQRPDVDGCIDVDVAATPLTNTFPIRRMAGIGVGEPITTPVAWIDVPRLTVTRVDQSYERLPDRDGLAAWRYGDPDHGSFVLTVDDDGLVVDYEGFARRVRS